MNVASETRAPYGATTTSRGPDSATLPPVPGGARAVLLASLALLSMISPFATDMYLPSFPRIAHDLSTSPSGVQLTLTTFLVGVAFGQLFFGPLSDRRGRKRPLVAGSLVCVGASLIAVYAPTIEVLLGARFFQGLGGAAGIVIARAIVADLFRGAEAASIFSVLAVLGGLGPIVAPVAGGLLAGPIGWRGVLGVLAVLTVVMSLVAVFIIRETAPIRRPGPDLLAASPGEQPAPTARPTHLWTVLRRPGFTAYALVKTFSFAALMGYISASSFIYQDYLGFGALTGSALFALNSLAMIGANAVNARLVRSRGPVKMLHAGLVLLTSAVVTLSLVVGLAGPPRALVPVLTLLVGSMGLIFGNSIGLAISNARDAAGSGSAIIGFGQFVAGATVAPLVGLGGRANPIPMTVLLAAATGATWVCAAVAKRASGPHE
ncbi:multidrug effflux MFS transporter [Terrabacter aerolatus]|uniref:Bcr/CflA family drug resistance efflux transporter n=1 Tax=Terrabacter aerolatus TaxID=422442 RepID=A0A512D4Z2_9MICO|nr:multidrug effflux MFS transporter [Terrabacter aerolatus]GEO31519.1 Bcr/CflA family drug resistance efflux transporter [Terrabacter aerolatus]